ncbi:cupin domain-containing protein [Clostridium sp.]|uniref:cupin domain-containing protein n=1 Tax=Clostridium sp. TaxID=1506 RepID=UPI003F410716
MEIRKYFKNNIELEEKLLKCKTKGEKTEIIYVYNGKYKQIINGETIVLEAGECCIINPNIKHKGYPITVDDKKGEVTIKIKGMYFEKEIKIEVKYLFI